MRFLIFFILLLIPLSIHAQEDSHTENKSSMFERLDMMPDMGEAQRIVREVGIVNQQIKRKETDMNDLHNIMSSTGKKITVTTRSDGKEGHEIQIMDIDKDVCEEMLRLTAQIYTSPYVGLEFIKTDLDQAKPLLSEGQKSMLCGEDTADITWIFAECTGRDTSLTDSCIAMNPIERPTNMRR